MREEEEEEEEGKEEEEEDGVCCAYLPNKTLLRACHITTKQEATTVQLNTNVTTLNEQ